MNQDFIAKQQSSFINSTLSLRGKSKGQKWLDDIPTLIKTYEAKWGLKSNGTFPELTFNYVEKVKTKNGEYLVLKIGFPQDLDFARQAKTLKLYSGNGAVKVLNEDIENSVLLLEGCIPGKSLHTLKDETKEVLIFTNIAKRLWRKAPEDPSFENISKTEEDFEWYFKNIKKAEKFLPEDLTTKAYELFKNLISTQKDTFLLHGDLHHDNIISSDRGWLAIDPKGVIGEREYECASFIFNPYKQFTENEDLISEEFFANRIELIAAALRFDKKRITQWAFVKSVSSLIWRIQDTNKVDKISIKIARALEKLV